MVKYQIFAQAITCLQEASTEQELDGVNRWYGYYGWGGYGGYYRGGKCKDKYDEKKCIKMNFSCPMQVRRAKFGPKSSFIGKRWKIHIFRKNKIMFSQVIYNYDLRYYTFSFLLEFLHHTHYLLQILHLYLDLNTD